MEWELTIGEIAARSGVPPSALRFYERAGLISSQRTSGNQRRYARAVLRRIAFIQAGKAAGIPLSDINRALDTLPTERVPTDRPRGAQNDEITSAPNASSVAVGAKSVNHT